MSSGFPFVAPFKEIKGSPIRELFKYLSTPGMRSFAGGYPAPELFELPGLQASIAAQSASLQETMSYGSSEGLPALRETLAALSIQRGLQVGQDDILVTSGSQQAYELLVRALIAPGDTALVERPAYPAAIQGLRLAGADMIIGIDLNDDKEQMARKFGMTHFINPSKIEGSVVQEIVKLTQRGNDHIGGVDYSFDATGNVKVMRDALECSHRGWGVSVIIGVAPAGAEIGTRPFQLVTGRVWKGTAFGGAKGRTDVPKFVDWYMDGKIEIDPMITHVLSLDEINHGFDLMHEGKSIRAVVTY